MFNFLHNYIPNAILGKIGPFTIHWYGLMIALGVLIAYFVFQYLLEKENLKIDIDLLLLYLFIFAIVGARLFYVIYAWDFYKNNLLEIFKIWKGGLAFYGGVSFGALALYLYCKKYKLSFLRFLDLFAVVIPLAQSIGRWGNYFNQELFGKPTNLAWGIPIEKISRPEAYKEFQYFHPTFLYESVLNFILFIFLFVLFKKKLKDWDSGILFVIYLFFYSMIRYFTEIFRIDYSPYIFGFRAFQYISILIFIISSVILVVYFSKKYARQKSKTKN